MTKNDQQLSKKVTEKVQRTNELTMRKTLNEVCVQSRQLVENRRQREGRALRGAPVTRARVHSARENVSLSRQGVHALYLSKLVQLFSKVRVQDVAQEVDGKLSNS